MKNKQIFISMLAVIFIAAATIFTGCKKEEITGVSVRPVAVMLAVGNTVSITPIFETATGFAFSADASWSSSDSKIASVDKNGLVTAHSVGEVVIICTTKEGGHSASTTVIVKPTKKDDDYATMVPNFYLGKTEIDGKTVDNDKLVTVKYHSINKILYVIDEKFSIPRNAGFIELTMKSTMVANITKEGETSNAACKTEVTIGGKTTTLSLDGTFNSNKMDLIINFEDFPDIGEVTINFKAFSIDSINE